MSIIVSLIQAYAAPSPLSLEGDPREELDAILPPFFQEAEYTERHTLPPSPMKWDIVVPRSIYDGEAYVGPTHTREVYISSPVPGAPRWVAKLETCTLRKTKILPCFLHAEEIAYRIGKAFKWNTIPKTKILHQWSLLTQEPKYQKYYRMMQHFVEQRGPEELPITFTFQAFVNGEPLPCRDDLNTKKKEKPTVLLSSYQKAYILGTILGKDDARGDNTMYNPETRELFEVDNEYIRAWYYGEFGILNCFSDLKREEIPHEILQDILRVSQDKLLAIQSKYTKRDLLLSSLQKKEPISVYVRDLENSLNQSWGQILRNFSILKDVTQSLIKQGAPVTLVTLEEQYKKAYIEHGRPEREAAALKAAQDKMAEDLAKEARLAKSRLEPPKLQRNMLSTIIDWIKMGHCVVLQSHGEEEEENITRIFYKGKEASVENLRVIYVDFSRFRAYLLNSMPWLDSIKQEGCQFADRAIQEQLCGPSKSQPHEVFRLKYL